MDVEEIIALWMANNILKYWSMALKFVVFQKNQSMNLGTLLNYIKYTARKS